MFIPHLAPAVNPNGTRPGINGPKGVGRSGRSVGPPADGPSHTPTRIEWSRMDDPVTRYEDAVEAPIRDPSPENYLAASLAHYDCACYVWLAPWWVVWYRERRLKRAVRRHPEAGGRIRLQRG